MPDIAPAGVPGYRSQPRAPFRGADAALQASLQNPPDPSTQSLRILIAEHDFEAAESLAALMKHWGIEVRIAQGDPHVLEEFESFHPDLILLDLEMPGMNGYDVCSRLRQSWGGRAVIIIATTANASQESRLEAYSSGFNRYFVKPILPERFEHLVARRPR